MMRYHLFSELLKDAIKKKLILKKDFYGTERPILDKLEQSYDKNINSVLNILKRRRLPFLKAKYGRHILKKFRYVDPLVLVEGSIKRLSLLLPGYLKIIKKHRQINKKGLFV